MKRPLAIHATPEELARSLHGRAGFVWLDSALPDAGATSYLAWEPSAICTSLVPELLQPSKRSDRSPLEADLPFTSGWIGYLAYEAAPLLDRDLLVTAGETALPLAHWSRYEALLVYRHLDQRWYLTSADTPEGASAAERMVDALDQLGSHSESNTAEPKVSPTSIHASCSRETHRAAVESLREWIARGHIYQANLTYRIEVALPGSPFALYRSLRRANPAPFAAYLALDGDRTVQSSSPELFLEKRGLSVRTRPIKGTRPRDPDDVAHDAALARELLASPKDHAELTMIVDLERNDLGKVCRTGSVRVSDFPVLESYRTVHHLVATVEGELRPEVDLHALLAATFPGGSVTGAPKIRAMELIQEHEPWPRSVYTGALGWIDDSGDLELALAIRTLWTSEGRAHLGVGGAIVIDSNAEDEWAETEHKARGMLAAFRAGAHS